ncbi:MAG TPA: hypothetical protein VGK99_16510 [Acidobacteriota bacterium]|jgi:hypothetical protein
MRSAGLLFAFALATLFLPDVLAAQSRQLVDDQERLKAMILSSQDPKVVERAVRDLIDGYLENGLCDPAQEWLSRARDRKMISNVAAYLLRIGQCFETRDSLRARQIFQKIILDYPDEKDEIGDRYAEFARRRLIWLSSDRSWMVRSASHLVRILTRSIRLQEFTALEKFASKVNFFLGACQSEYLNSDMEEMSAFLSENFSPKIRVAPSIRKFPYQEGWYVLETRGWSIPYNYIYFLMQPIKGGWEWIGAIYCDEPILEKK